MKYAQFKDPTLGFVTVVSRADNDLDRPFCDDVRISEWIEIDFPPRKSDEVIAAQLAALDAQQQTLVAEHLTALQKIAEARSKLLALTHDALSEPAP